MYSCRKQDTLVSIIPASKYGQAYDIARVTATFQLDSALPESDPLLIPPQTEVVPTEILKTMELNHVNFVPMPESYITEALSDFAPESADPNREKETREDAVLGLTRRYFTKAQLQQIGTGYFYKVNYEYNVYPDSNKTFHLYAVVPFKGFTMPQGSEVRFVCILPSGITEIKTNGIDSSANQIQVDKDIVANDLNVISYFWRNDPEFFVEYKY